MLMIKHFERLAAVIIVRKNCAVKIYYIYARPSSSIKSSDIIIMYKSKTFYGKVRLRRVNFKIYLSRIITLYSLFFYFFFFFMAWKV